MRKRVINESGQWLCRSCNLFCVLDDFRLKSDGSGNRQSYCNDCWRKRCSLWNRNNLDRFDIIIRNTSSVDRSKGLRCDLTKSFVVKSFLEPCVYCLSKTGHMTLDRKDNNLGHTEDNCLPCCFECNRTRGNMPYEAWLLLVPGMRKARESGLLDGWNAGKTRTLEEKNSQQG